MYKLELTLIQTKVKVEELKDLLKLLPTDVEASKLVDRLEAYQSYVQQQITRIWENKQNV